MVEFVIDCDPVLKNKIKFVTDAFSEFIANDGYIDKKIILLYSDKSDVTVGYDILIKCDNAARELFLNCKEYNSDISKNYIIKDELIPVLFHNDSQTAFDFHEPSGKLSINIDIFASSFYFLSLWQEYVSDVRDAHLRYNAKNSLQKKLNILNKPIVTIYFNWLKSLIKKYYGITFKDRTASLAMTHDIDYIKKWSPGIVYRELIQNLLLNYRNVSIGERISRLKAFIKAFRNENDPYRYSLLKMIDYEMQNNVKSTYFIKAGCTSKHDVSYSLKNKFLKLCVKKLRDNGFDIGLHPSYKAYNNETIMRKELNNFLRIFNFKPSGVREHFLRYDIKTTPIIHEKLGFVYDSSLGYNDYDGFRTGFSYPHKLYDIKNDCPLNIIEIPLITMDATLESYRKLNPQESLDAVKEMMNQIIKYGGIFTLLFHNICYDDLDYKGWGDVYEGSIEYAKKKEIQVTSLNRIFEEYSKHKI